MEFCGDLPEDGVSAFKESDKKAVIQPDGGEPPGLTVTLGYSGPFGRAIAILHKCCPSIREKISFTSFLLPARNWRCACYLR